MNSVKEIFNTMEYGTAPESAATAEAWLSDHNREFSLFIDGKFVTPEGAKMLEVTAPATGETLDRKSVV